MKPLHNLYLLLNAASLTFMSVGCKRDIPILSESPVDERRVTFKLSGFGSKVTPFPARVALTQLAAADARESYVEPRDLYYWSFNDETLIPDISVVNAGGDLAFEANAAGPDFVNGLALAPFEAGRALSIRGARILSISLPLTGTESLVDFSFDIKSSDTGPKDFSLSYSIDGGLTYEVLRASNPFEKTKSTQWNRYTFDISGFDEWVHAELLKFKIDFLAGDRGEGGTYNESSGTVHLDNIRLTGIHHAETGGETDPTMPSTLHYYVLSSQDGSVVEQRELPIGELTGDGTLTVGLPKGLYDVLFVAYRSEKGLRLPESLANAGAFYLGQDFDDYRAVTYALLLEDFEVGDADVSAPAVLTRCFSAVEFDFTDVVADFTAVDRIDIARLHPNYLFTPFGEPVHIPEGDVDSFTLAPTGLLNGQPLVFHQFLGMPGEPRIVEYLVTAYGKEGEVLNSVHVSERIVNNVQLVFRGHLLGESSPLMVRINPDWDDAIEHRF